jgi:hypothetical protein
MHWTVQKLCTDVNDYELIIEKQKASFHCEQKVDSWRWHVSYRGAVISQGTANDQEQARELAEKNVPQNQ